MPLSALLDVAIGVALIFLTLSAVCSSINELIARAVHLRAKYLLSGLASLLTDQNNDLYADVIRHPLLRRLGTDPREFPSYISSDNFALALMDALRARAGGPSALVNRLRVEIQNITDSSAKKALQDALANADPRVALEEVRLAVARVQDPEVRASVADFLNAFEVNEIKQGILAVPDPAIQQVMLTLLNETETQVQKLADIKTRLETWFDDGMSRVTELYKHYVEWILRILALATCLLFNADAIHVVNSLWQDPTLRAALVAQAQQAAQNPPSTSAPTPSLGDQAQNVAQVLNQLNGLPLGWNCREYDAIMREGWQSGAAQGTAAGSGLCEVIDGHPIAGGSFSLLNLLLKIVGILLMALGVSFGAPFWFNVITRIVPLRADKQRAT